MKQRGTQLLGRILRNENSQRQKARHQTHRSTRFYGALVVLLATWVSETVHAAPTATDEPYNTGWSIQADNDLLAGSDNDQNYTGGFILSFSGRRAKESLVSPIRAIDWLDNVTGFNRFLNRNPHHSIHALEFGTALFTPANIQTSAVVTRDRPYASLFFINGTRQSVIPSLKLSVRTGFTVGLLGLDLAETLQQTIHSVIGSDQPQGWGNQVSQGGELTAKYSIGLQRAAFQRRHRKGFAQEFNWTSQLDLGFISGISVGGNWRFGKINSPWWSFNPHQSDYLNLGSNIGSGKTGPSLKKERYLYAGFSFTHNVYNAFVQGQFRNSAFTVRRSDIVADTAEAWVGTSIGLNNTYKVDLFLRARSQELRLPDAESLAWGGLIFSRSI